MHLIRYCSICGNKCGRLSDSLPPCHVSSPLPVRLPPALLVSALSSSFTAALQFPPKFFTVAPSTRGLFPQAQLLSCLSPPHLLYNPSQQITTLSNSFLYPNARLLLLQLPPVYSACLLIVFCSSLSPTNLIHKPGLGMVLLVLFRFRLI